MKIIITGKTSYIGTNVKAFFEEKGHICKSVSLRNGLNDIDFTGFDVVVHCSAIVHKKESKVKALYEKINKTLAIDTAKKAKLQGIKHFIFLSSMSVYGNNVTQISKNTKTEPKSMYGKTKLLAEKEILKLADNDFAVSILRPPMVYGKNCPGNFRKLEKLVKFLPIFPKTANKRSTLYVKNLAFFIYTLAKDKNGNRKNGIFLPMDNIYVSTRLIAETIAKKSGKKIKFSKISGKVVEIFKNKSIIKKAFGNLFYDESCATKIKYIDFEKAIAETETKSE